MIRVTARAKKPHNRSGLRFATDSPTADFKLNLHGENSDSKSTLPSQQMLVINGLMYKAEKVVLYTLDSPDPFRPHQRKQLGITMFGDRNVHNVVLAAKESGAQVHVAVNGAVAEGHITFVESIMDNALTYRYRMNVVVDVL